ncbi:MAG TPA: FAD-dependent oxidoreductase [Leptospiraceae bacterium]|nr:FAD-dependent oxidoreductase [Leptospiraceae bacterium]
MKVKILIIGSGPTGLGAGYRLKEKGETDFLILEKTDYIGGLATSFTDSKGFTWDIGGHVQFSHYRYFDEVMIKALGKDGWLHHERESWVWMEDRFVPYPFQNNIRYLKKETMWECLSGIIKAVQNQSGRTPANFHEWIDTVFGPGIAAHFMIPYNYKVWAFPPEDMAYQWIGERVAITDLKRVTENILFEKDDFSWGPNNTFQFPLNGGTGAIWNAVGEMTGRDKIRLNSEVQEIDPSAKTLKLKDGTEIEYEILLSTMPVDIMTKLVKGLNPEIPKLASGLKHSSSNIIGIGLKGKPKESLEKKCWMYFPEKNCPFYRVTVFSNYSPNNVPDINQYWSLMTETSESPKKYVNRKTLIEDTIQGLLNTKLIDDRNDIVSVWEFNADYGYPTPSLERDGIIKKILPELDKIGIYSRGRFGGWKYEVSNQDHAMMQGVEWTNMILDGIPEITLFHPSVANANYAK